MQLPDWPVYVFLVLGGVVVLVLAFVFYVLPMPRVKMPAILACSLAALAVGVGLGMAAMASLGYRLEQANPEVKVTMAPVGGGLAAPGGGGGMMGGGGGGGMGRGGGGMGRGGGGMGGGGRGGGRGPNSKAQLATLVGKLDQLTAKPLKITLSEEQKKKVGEQLKDLDVAENLSEEEAKKKLDALQEVLKNDKETLEAAGYPWPDTAGTGGRGPAPDAPNPFKQPENGKHLKSLQDQVGKAK